MKLRELQKVLKKKKLDGCILSDKDPNFTYYLQNRPLEGKLFIPSSGKPTIFLHPLEELKHKFNIVRLEDKKTFRNFFKKKIKVGYNPSYTTAKQYFQLRSMFKMLDIGTELEKIRIIKTEQEIKYLKKAASIADEILMKLIKNFKKMNFKTEGDIKKFLKQETAARGLKESFEPIVATGKGSATPHYFGDKKLVKGFMIVDMGVVWKGYISDITRTFYLGKPGKYEKKLYNDILKFQKKTIKMCTEGTKCKDAYNYVKALLGDNFTHGLGHGIGLKVHELPNLKPNSEEVFENNMVFTVEPGWYDETKNIGIRIEDDVLIKNGKPVVITKTPKKLICF